MNAIRFFRSTALGALLFLPAAPCLSQPAAAATNALPLWKLPGQSNTVWLLGSIHFCNEDFYPLAKPIEDAYRNSGTLVLEIDLAEEKSLATQMLILREGMNPPGQTLSQQISKETFAALQKWAEKELGDVTIFELQKPWMATVTLMVLEIQKLGFNPELGIDKHFYRKAQADEKRVVGLETTAFQIGLFTELTKEEQEDLLKSTLKEIGKLPEMFRDIIKGWKSGDAKALEPLLNDATKEYPGIWKRLVLDRNEKWIARIEKFREQPKDVFVVVGMGHLIGEGSVVDLLRKKGFKVEQQQFVPSAGRTSQ
jgi:uncharacterized protein YbaP (TraB family)